MPKFTAFPCESGACGYTAYSEDALDDHMVTTHGGSPSVATPASVAPPVEVEEPPAQVPDPTPDEPETIPHHPSLFKPNADEAFWVEDSTLRWLVVIEQRAGFGENVNVFLTGPTGTGKSSLPEQFAALQGRLCFVQHCELITEPGDWWGQKEMSVDKGTYFSEAAFVSAIETPGTVVIMDELNRTHPDNLNALFGLLDHRRRAWVPMMEREVKVASGVTFWFTMNMGFDYQVNPVDMALMNRAQITLPLRYPPKEWEVKIMRERAGVDEETAEKLAEFAQTVRNNPRLQVSISPRQLIEAGINVRLGIPIHDAVMATCINGAVEDMDKTALLQALQTVGPIDGAYVGGSNAN